MRRFDRVGHTGKLAVEDFAQIAGLSRETKYDSSMERLVGLLDAHCTFPAIEKVKLLKRSLFNFLVGNEDMHLKNFSLITRQGKVELAPAYDYLNTTVAYLALGKRIETLEEVALPRRGKKRRLSAKDWIGYYASERQQLPPKIIDRVRAELLKSIPGWRRRIAQSFLPGDQQDHNRSLVAERLDALDWCAAH